MLPSGTKFPFCPASGRASALCKERRLQKQRVSDFDVRTEPQQTTDCGKVKLGPETSIVMDGEYKETALPVFVFLSS